MLQPALSTLIEFTLWFAVFRGLATAELAGFTRENYLAYALWAGFVGRITSNWMYEFRMIEEIDLGSINGLLMRPISFYEYYLSQFMGYKLSSSLFSLGFPVAISLWLGLPTNLSHLPAALLLIVYYLVLAHTVSFCVAALAFRLNKVHGITMAKNLGLWLFSGELFPLDLLPAGWKTFMLALPFANAVYIPVGYLTGRVDAQLLLQGYFTTTLGLLFFGALAAYLWKSGLRRYTGTGA